MEVLDCSVGISQYTPATLCVSMHCCTLVIERSDEDGKSSETTQTEEDDKIRREACSEESVKTPHSSTSSTETSSPARPRAFASPSRDPSSGSTDLFQRSEGSVERQTMTYTLELVLCESVVAIEETNLEVVWKIFRKVFLSYAIS